ncbi:TPA: type II secretion system protein GspL [Photobacterium damselae]
MSEFLTIRLSSQSTSPVQWLVWSPTEREVIASGQLPDSSHLGDLTEYAAQRPVYVVVPTSEMLLTQVTIPAGSSRQLSAVLPYLLEEELAQDVESLHVQLLKREKDIASVAVVEHSKMAYWLEQFKQHHFEVRKLLPDSLCLPLFNDGYSAAQLEQQWLIRQSETLGINVEISWLDAWLSAQKAPIVLTKDEQDESTEESAAEGEVIATTEAIAAQDEDLSQVIIHHYTPAPEVQLGRWRAETPELVMQLLAQGAESSKLNLLSGAYKPQAAWRKHLLPWRKVAIAAGLVLTSLVAEHVIAVNQMENQAQAYRTESERIFRQVLPQFKRIPSQSYLRNQMKRAVASMGGEQQQGLLTWLLELQPMLKQVPQMQFTNFKYDQKRGELRIQANSTDFQHFEKLRTLLAKDFTVEQGQLSKEDGRVNGAFVLRRHG